MFENITNLKASIQSEVLGEWVFDKKSKGTIEDPIRMPYIHYSDAIYDLIQAIYAFSDEHPEYALKEYQSILNESGLSWKRDSMRKADVSTADGQLVMALLMAAIRAERFCDGILLGLCEDGTIVKWLLRLTEIDAGK